MLSFIYSLARRFESAHSVSPNLLYLSSRHLHHLRRELHESLDMDMLPHLLGMEIVISNETVHPHVAWAPVAWDRAVAG